MAERTISEKEVKEHLRAEGFKEIKAAEKESAWYKKASQQPSCFKAVRKEKLRR